MFSDVTVLIAKVLTICGSRPASSQVISKFSQVTPIEQKTHALA